MLQQEAYDKALFTTLSIAQGYRGVFVPFTVISPVLPACIFRLVYPTLLVVPEQPAIAHLYDVRTGLLQHTIKFPSHLRNIDIRYLDFSERHVFFCAGEDGLIIYPRERASASRMIRFQPSEPMSRISSVSVYEFRTTPVSTVPTLPVVELHQVDLMCPNVSRVAARNFWKSVGIGDCSPDRLSTLTDHIQSTRLCLWLTHCVCRSRQLYIYHSRLRSLAK